MERRAFLKTAAALPAGLELFAFGQTEASHAAGEVHVVGEGKDRGGEKHSLGYSTMLFKTTTRDTRGDMFVIEHRGLRQPGPPVHLHLHQDEWFYVLEGEVLIQVGDKRNTLKPGDSLLGPRGIAHGFVGVGDQPARMIISFTPAGKMEEFFRLVAVPNGPKLEAALFVKYEMQYVGPAVTV